MGKKPKIPDWVREELDGLYTLVPRADGSVSLYGGRIEHPTGYPRMEVREDGIYEMDAHGFELKDNTARARVEYLMCIACRDGRTAMPWRERKAAFFRERRAILRACRGEDAREAIEALYQKCFREADPEAMIAPDGAPQEGLVAFCQRDGRVAAVYTRDDAELKLLDRVDCDEPAWRLYACVDLLPSICVLNAIEARYGLHFPRERWLYIFEALKTM